MSDPQELWWLTGSATAVGLLLAALVARVLRGLPLPPGGDPEAVVKFAEGERDRMQAVARGIGTSSAGFIAAIFTAVLEGKIAAEIPPAILVLVLLGAVGMLLLAAAQSQASARFMASAVATSQQAVPGH